MAARSLAAPWAIRLLALGGFASADSRTPTGSATATASATAAPGATLPLHAGGGESGIIVKHLMPGSMTVQTGTVVTWKNVFGDPHTVTFGNPLSSAFTSSGTSFELTFSKAGSYQYICLLHDEEGMAGAVNVSAAATSPTATAPTTTAPKPPNTGSGASASSGTSLWMALGLAAALLALTGAGVFAVKRQS